MNVKAIILTVTWYDMGNPRSAPGLPPILGILSQAAIIVKVCMTLLCFILIFVCVVCGDLTTLEM